jgi:hypothetical protein
VSNYGNKNVGNISIEEQNADWTNTAAPPEVDKMEGEGWGEDNTATTEQPQASFEEVDKATIEAAPAAAPEKEKEKDKEEEAPTKGLEEYLAEQKKKVEELATLLANKEISTPVPRTVEKDESGGRYVEVHRLTNQLPKKPKTEKPVEAEPSKKPKAQKPATGETTEPAKKPEFFFNVKKQQTGRRYGKEDYVVFEEKEKQAKKNFKDFKKENKDATAAKEGGEQQQQTGEENTPAKEKNENERNDTPSSGRPPRRGGRQGQGGRGPRRGGGGGGGGGRRNNYNRDAPRGNTQATGGTFSTEDWPELKV